MCSSWVTIFVALALLVAEASTSPLNSDEDSGSIELPDRPENRQEVQALNKDAKQDPQTFLKLLSKVMGSLKHSLQNTSRRVDQGLTLKGAVNKAKKALNGLHKAYAHVEKAKKQLIALGVYKSR